MDDSHFGIFCLLFFLVKALQTHSLKDIIGHFLMTRIRVLDATYEAAELGGKVDVAVLVDVSDAPKGTKDEYCFWVTTLIEYFKALIQTRAVTYSELVRSTLKNRTTYLLSVNKLNKAARNFNKALTPFLPNNEEDIANIVKKMEESIEKFRRDQAKEIFPQ